MKQDPEQWTNFFLVLPEFLFIKLRPNVIPPFTSENPLVLKEYEDDFTLNIKPVVTVLSVLSIAAVMLLYSFVIFYMAKKHHESEKNFHASSNEPPKVSNLK